MANTITIDRESIRLIDFNKPDLIDPLNAYWHQRKEQIATEMEASQAGAMQRLTSVQVDRNIDPRVVDAAHVIGKFTETDTSVGRIAQKDDPGTLVFALRKLGPQGRLYYIQPGADSDQVLRADLFREFIRTILPKKATTPEELARVQRRENHLFELGYPFNYATLLRGFLEDPSIPGITSLYRNRKPNEAQAAFYQAFPITPIGGELPGSLSVIPDQSLRAFFVVDYFSKLQGDKQPALAEQLLRVLQPGGKLLFRDTADGQAAAEYYIDQVAFNRLIRRDLRDLANPRAWMLFTRRNMPDTSYSFPSTEAPVEKTEHQKKLERLAAEVYSVLLESGVTDKSRSLDEVSAAARKIVGFTWLGQHGLSGIAMAEFKGDFSKMFAFAIETSMPKAVEPEASIPAASESVPIAKVGVVDVPEISAVPARAVAIETTAEAPAASQASNIIYEPERFNAQNNWPLIDIINIVAEDLGQAIDPHKAERLLDERGLVRVLKGDEANSAKRRVANAFINPKSAAVIANVLFENADSLKSKKGGRRGY